MRLLCLSTVFLLLGYFPFKGHSLECYVCNSANDPGCGDPFKPFTIGVMNCSLKAPPEHLDEEHRESKVCRKIVQKIQGTIRIVRTCGYLTDAERDDKLCLRRSGTHDVNIDYCSCTKSLCNAANPKLSLTHAPLAALASAILATVFRPL